MGYGIGIWGGTMGMDFSGYRVIYQLTNGYVRQPCRGLCNISTYQPLLAFLLRPHSTFKHSDRDVQYRPSLSFFGPEILRTSIARMSIRSHVHHQLNFLSSRWIT